MQQKETIDLDGHPDSAEDAQKLLKGIREKELRVVEDEFERRQNRTQSFHDYIQRQLDHPAQVLPELIQNADDIKTCDTVEIELTDDTLRIRNNGRPMKTEEVDTLCAAGESTKRDPEYIGHFGLGFKSVFSISDNPRVRSGYFHLEFDADQLTVPTICDISEPVNGTEIELPLKDDLSSQKRDELQNRLDEVYRLLTYLRNISQIEVTQDNSTTVYRRESDADSPELVIYKDGEGFERRLVFTTDETPSGEAFEQLAEERQIDDRETIRESPISVTISFEVDNRHHPLSKAEECYLFNFLPTDERSGFPFDVHADFLLEPSRKALAWREGAYNQWLLRRVGDTYRRIVEYYNSLNGERVGHLRLLPSQEHGLDHTDAAKEAVLDALRDEDSIPGQDGDYHRPETVVVPTYHVENVFARSDVQHLLGRDVMYPSESMDEALLTSLCERGVLEEVSVEELLKRSEDSAREGFSEASTAHLLVFAAALWEYWDDEYRNLSTFSDKRDARNKFEKIVKSTPLVPIENGDRVAVSDSGDDPLLPPKQGREEYDIFEDEFRLVKLDSASIPEEYPAEPWEIVKGAREFYSQVLEIETISSDIVLKEIVADAFDDVEAVNDDTLDTYLRYIFSNKNRWTAARKHVDLKFRVQEASNDAIYRDPSKTDVFLPDVYYGETSRPSYSLETVLDGLDPTFISEDYIALTGESQPERWREFLTQCDVLDRLPVKELSIRNRTFYTHREELVDSLSECTQAKAKEDWSIPDSQKKGGSKYPWFAKGQRYALSDYVPSDWFQDVLSKFSDDEGSELDRAEAFDRMLQEYWTNYEEKLYRPLYYVVKGRAYKVRRTQTDRYSSFGELLRDTPWCLTKDETLSPPRTLLVENPATANQPPQMYIARESSPYLESLGVKTQLGLDVALEQLSNAPSVWGNADPPTIRQELTSRLDTLQQKLLDDGTDVEKEIKEALSDARFIYIEGADPEFRSPNDVVWNGQDMGSYIVSIESEYGKYEDLFHTIGVQTFLQAADYLDYLADTAWNDDAERDTVWRRTVRKLVAENSEITSFQGIDRAVREKLAEQCLLTLSGEVASLEQLDYYCHDNTILEHLQSNVAETVVKPYDRWDYAQETIAEMWELLGLENLADTAALSLIDSNAAVSEEGPVRKSDEFSQLFTAAYSFCVENEHEEACEDLLNIFAEYQITVHETIECQYLSLSGEPLTGDFEVSCYLDRSDRAIRRTKGTSSLQALAHRLSHELSLSATEAEELESVLSGALGKRERFLNSFLETFGIERRAIEAEIASDDGSGGGAAEAADDLEAPEQGTHDESGSGASAEVVSGEESDDNEEPVVSAGNASNVGNRTGSGGADSSSSGGASASDSGSSDNRISDASEASSGKHDDVSKSTSQQQNRDEREQDTKGEPKPVEEGRGDIKETVERRRTTTMRTVRDDEFRRAVRDAYDNTCAICGNRRETKDGQPEVEAAHIRPASKKGPDMVQNGLALCRLHHWSFEKGWIAISDNYKIIVRDWESVPGYEEFSQYRGCSLHLPEDEQKHPSSSYLRYHRRSHEFEE
ncbi:sacsin N-terminal ATP-binding-like domain-containing protein [Haloarcula sp. AONF1]